MPTTQRKPPPVRRRQVAVLIETSNAYARGLLQGVVHYIREHRPWSFHLMEQGRGDDPPAWLTGWRGDGIIARIETPKIARAVVRTGLPAVDVSAARLVPALPWVETDDEAIAHLAAEHLMERGFKRFAFCGDGRFNWSLWREKHFAGRLKQAGHDCAVYRPLEPSVDGAGDVAAEARNLAQWLKGLPKPVGIMACYDIRGQQVLDACRGAGLPVPDEVAVIGVDNDALLCDLASPPLSSVKPNAHRAGYEAAALLDRMMAGKKVAAKAHLIAPLGVAERQSTEVLAVDDRDVARAVQFIREHATEGIQVGDVLKAVPLSRRVLEQRFQKLLGLTPRAEILRTRLERVKQLLAQTELPLYIVAERTGFEHAEYLSVLFKRETGRTPSDWRTEAQGRK
ncbi:MAG: DNA-binding transcriptional regulator [Opitutaceae bacterium]|nr:DNA-binding transcriptional regulator [Opitutaceae bacterium]